MREYGKIVPRFWTGGTGAQLRGDPIAQVVAAYLSTCPSGHPIGIFYLPLVTMAHEVGQPVEVVRKALTKLATADFAHYDEAESLVWVPSMARVALGEELAEKDRRRPWVWKELEQHKGHRFYRAFLSRYGASYGFEVPPEAPSKPLPSPIDGAAPPEKREHGVVSSGGCAAPPAPPPPPKARARKPEKPPMLPGADDPSPASKPEAPVSLGWRVWLELYPLSQHHRGQSYARAPPDGKAMQALVANALEQLKLDHRPETDLEPLLRHQLAAYLVDRGSREFSLVAKGHGLQWFGHNVASYGTPWGGGGPVSLEPASPNRNLDFLDHHRNLEHQGHG